MLFGICDLVFLNREAFGLRGWRKILWEVGMVRAEAWTELRCERCVMDGASDSGFVRVWETL